MNSESTNPWGLTPAEVRAMDALCEHGCHKLAARALGFSTRTVEQHSWTAGQKMGHRTRLGRFLEWDRWRRGAAVCVDGAK